MRCGWRELSSADDYRQSEKDTSRCFSDEFLASVQAQTGVATERPFKAVEPESITRLCKKC
jgi:hypothetical protein